MLIYVEVHFRRFNQHQRTFHFCPWRARLSAIWLLSLTLTTDHRSVSISHRRSWQMIFLDPDLYLLSDLTLDAWVAGHGHGIVTKYICSGKRLVQPSLSVSPQAALWLHTRLWSIHPPLLDQVGKACVDCVPRASPIIADQARLITNCDWTASSLCMQ